MTVERDNKSVRLTLTHCLSPYLHIYQFKDKITHYKYTLLMNKREKGQPLLLLSIDQDNPVYKIRPKTVN